MKATIYHNPDCSKSCNALAFLEENNFDINIRLYLQTGVTRGEIYDILELLNADIAEIFREKETSFIQEYSEDFLFSKEMLINAIIEKPILLQRPIILLKEIGIGIVARSEESLNQLMTRIKEDLI